MVKYSTPQNANIQQSQIVGSQISTFRFSSYRRLHLEISDFSLSYPTILWLILDGHADGGYPVCVGAYVQLLRVCADASGSH